MAASAHSGQGRVLTGRPGSHRGAFFILIVCNALWAGTYAAGKIALRDLSPVELNAIRFLLASLILLPVTVRGWRQIPRDRATLLALGRLVLLGWVLNKTFEYLGLSLSTASDVALLISTESLFTAVLSWTFLRERITRTGIAALLIGLTGAYLIVERGFMPSLGGAAGHTRVLGDLLVVLSLMMEAGYTVTGKATISRIPPLLLVSVTLLGSLFVWVPAGTVAIIHSGWPHLTWPSVLAVLYMAAIATALCYWLWFRGLASVDASAAAPVLFIQPLLGALLAIWLLHDTLSWATVLGGLLIAMSLLLVMRSERRREVLVPEPVA